MHQTTNTMFMNSFESIFLVQKPRLSLDMLLEYFIKNRIFHRIDIFFYCYWHNIVIECWKVLCAQYEGERKNKIYWLVFWMFVVVIIGCNSKSAICDISLNISIELIDYIITLSLLGVLLPTINASKLLHYVNKSAELIISVLCDTVFV